MAIRMKEEGAAAMEPAKNAFLAAGMAGEVCRCTLAIIDEFLYVDPQTDVTDCCLQLESEAVELGVISMISDAIMKLKEAARDRRVDEHLLREVWSRFGPYYGANFSAAEMTRN